MKRILKIAAALGAGMMLASTAMADTSPISPEVDRQATVIVDLAQCVLPQASVLDAAMAAGAYETQTEAAKQSINDAVREMIKCSLTFKRAYVGRSM